MSTSKQEKDVAPFYETEAHPLKALGCVAFSMADAPIILTNDTGNCTSKGGNKKTLQAALGVSKGAVSQWLKRARIQGVEA